MTSAVCYCKSEEISNFTKDIAAAVHLEALLQFTKEPLPETEKYLIQNHLQMQMLSFTVPQTAWCFNQ